LRSGFENNPARPLRGTPSSVRRLPHLRALSFFFAINSASFNEDCGTACRFGEAWAGVEREIAVSTLGQPHLDPAWKQEVSRRIAAHRNRKGKEAASQSTPAAHHFGSSLAAEAAARVAARYAKAPSYSQMQAEEARVAVRAAEIATQVALEAQAVAEDALAELHAAARAPSMRGPAVVESIARPAAGERGQAAGAVEQATSVAESATEVAKLRSAPGPAGAIACQPETVPPSGADLRPIAIRWDPETPVRATKPAPPEDFELSAEDWWTPAQVGETLRSEPIVVDPEPAHANLIEFPRELVATRRMRPRLAEAPFESKPSGEAQLSIFEVDPGAISTEPAAAAADSSRWIGPEWSGIKLDEHPATEPAQEAELPAPGPRVFLAPLVLRLLATVVDTSLIVAVFVASALYLASQMQHLPAAKPAELLVLAGLVLAGLLYHVLFFAAGFSTPGMRYAGIALCTFDDECPTRTQMRRRLGAMLLSLAPVGLGYAWSIFDEDHLTWHDRISQTYLRKR
jgi:uncharacterized RDD family membrane protein YckC